MNAVPRSRKHFVGVLRRRPLLDSIVTMPHGTVAVTPDDVCRMLDSGDPGPDTSVDDAES